METWGTLCFVLPRLSVQLASVDEHLPIGAGPREPLQAQAKGQEKGLEISSPSSLWEVGTKRFLQCPGNAVKIA